MQTKTLQYRTVKKKKIITTSFIRVGCFLFNSIGRVRVASVPPKTARALSFGFLFLLSADLSSLQGCRGSHVPEPRQSVPVLWNATLTPGVACSIQTAPFRHCVQRSEKCALLVMWPTYTLLYRSIHGHLNPECPYFGHLVAFSN